MKTCYFLLILFFSWGFYSTSHAQSPLEKAGLIKIGTTRAGIYKLDQQFFQEAGIDPSTINPNKVQVYGMEGGLIPQANTINFPQSPEALAIFVNADGDNQFENGESILFYADDVADIHFDKELNTYTYEQNYYTDTLFYFVDVSLASNPRLISPSQKQVNTSQNRLNYYDYLSIHDKELSNILSSGRQWFGESFFVQKSRDFNFSFPNSIHNNQIIDVETQYLAQTYSPDSLRIFVNDFLLAYQPLPTISAISYTDEGKIVNNKSKFNTTLVSEDNNLTIKLSHLSNSNLKSEGKVDYLFITVPLSLQFGSEQIILRNRKYNSDQPFTVDFGSTKPDFVWDVSNPSTPNVVQLSSNEFHYSPIGESNVKFVAFNIEQAYKPSFIQLLPSIALNINNVPDLLIIAHAKFLSAAQLLASHRSSVDGFNVKVVDQADVFNQFGSGRRDVSALRNFIRAHYLADPQKLRYVLLFGGGSYDFKHREQDNTNYIPIYQSRNSINPTATYASDDFYVFMDENEGEWPENSNDISDMDLGIGRIPSRTADDAMHIVQKIIRYETDHSLQGKWRNELYFVADDEDVNSDTNAFYRQSDQLADSLADKYGNVQPNKLYIGSYEQEVFASYERSPAMQEALGKMMQKGALIVNYIGHGAYNSWTDEAILTNNLITSWKNKDHFPLFVTATCEFGRHDSPGLVSGAQVLLHQKNSGAIGLLTTSRPVFSNTNFELNKAFYQSAFERNTLGVGKRLGDIIKDTKNNSISGVKNRNFILLGDPSLTLGLPKRQIVINKIETASQAGDTIKAQDMVSISGYIANNQQDIVSGFTGTIVAELFDKPSKRKTLTTDEEPYIYSASENVLFRGRGSVKDGKFELTFYVPKEMSYQIGNGQLKFYAYQNNSMEDAGGFNNEILIGGSISNNQEDKFGPDIALFLNDSTFLSGDKVGSKNDLIVKLRDDFGISISNSNLNPGMYYELDGTITENINDYFYYDVDSYQEGSARLTLPELSEGKHDISVFARDVFNNLSQNHLDFYVVNSSSVTILEFVLYPNPAITDAVVQFTHSRKDEEILVDLKVIDHLGRQVYTTQFETDAYKNKLIWDLKNSEGEKVAQGMYFINLIVRSESDGSKSQQIKKLIIIN